MHNQNQCRNIQNNIYGIVYSTINHIDREIRKHLIRTIDNPNNIAYDAMLTYRRNTNKIKLI